MKYYRICRVKCRWCGDLLEHINQAKADSHFRIRWCRCGKVGLDPAAVGYRIMGEPAAYEDLSEECDGYTNFLVVTEGGKPRVPRDYSRIFSGMLRKYNKSGRRMIEHLTSHTLRHTFATNCSNAGMSVKSTQYLMGHSDASMTLNVYTKSVWENVVKDTKLLGGEELCAPLKVVNG